MRLQSHFAPDIMACMKKAFITLTLLVALSWGLGRLYFETTAGFTLGNITSDFSYDPRFETKTDNMERIQKILGQSWRYLGKGCQSYVFESDDGQYVMKFFKYQRFRTPRFLDWLSVVPQINKYRMEKTAKKREKLDALFASCALASNRLSDETGLVYVHLNKTADLNQITTIYDKLGLAHRVNLDELEFMVQVKSEMLCPTLDRLVGEKKTTEAKKLLSRLVAMVADEYEKGLADNDHALMQNTGVYQGQPIHIDVGQFVVNEQMQLPQKAHQELYNKTYKFRIWLQENHPELKVHLESQLREYMGPDFETLTFIPKK